MSVGRREKQLIFLSREAGAEDLAEDLADWFQDGLLRHKISCILSSKKRTDWRIRSEIKKVRDSRASNKKGLHCHSCPACRPVLISNGER